MFTTAGCRVDEERGMEFFDGGSTADVWERWARGWKGRAAVTGLLDISEAAGRKCSKKRGTSPA